MKITIKQDATLSETEITILCRDMTPALREAIATLSLTDCTVTGSRDGETFFVPLGDIFYFEVVDGRVFFYDAHGMYETATPLYKLEEMCVGTSFSRISKSCMVNLRRVRSIKREGNSRLCATLTNGERLMVSRQYLPVIRERLGV